MKMPDMEAVVATDGSALNNPAGPAGWAWFINEKCWSYGSFPKASNQAMEMYAILQALTMIPSHIDIHIQTDSAFCVNMIGKNGGDGWMQGWKRRGWVKADNKIPANLKLVRSLDSAILNRRGHLVLEWVKGHNGHRLNSMADKLCTTASASQSKGIQVKGGPGWNDNITTLILSPVIQHSHKSAPVKRRSASAIKDRSIIISFDDGLLMPPKRNSPSVQKEYCTACDGLINTETGECSCSD